MIDSLTASAVRSLERADRLARSRGSTSVEPMDLLAALAVEQESRAVDLMVECGVDMALLRASLSSEVMESLTEPVEAEIGLTSSSDPSSLKHLPLSPLMRAVLSDATMQARAVDRKRDVGTEHLLAGLLLSPGPGRGVTDGGRPGP